MQDYNDIRIYLEQDLYRVQEQIRSALSSDIQLLNTTNNSILDNTGKLVRPVLSLLVARLIEPNKDLSLDTIRLAAASELLHNATLLHDDVADNSSCRRGRPTVMSVLGGRAAVLLGDYWMVKSMDQILQTDRNTAILLGHFSNTLKELAEGELLQIEKTIQCDTDEEDYIRIIYNKTASLFVTAAKTAAITVEADDKQILAVSEFASCLGKAFQIKDDILDYIGNDIGKPLGQDLQEQKITLPLLGAFKNSSKSEEQQIREKLRHILDKPEYQQDIVSFVLEYEGIKYAEEYEGKLMCRAKESISDLKDNPAKEYLHSLADFVIGRKK